MPTFEILAFSTMAMAVVVLVVLVVIAAAAYFLRPGDGENSEYPHLAGIQTVELDGEDGPVTAIMANFNFDAPLTNEMVSEAITAIKCQRMLSPPDTSALLITIIGSVTGAQFAKEWRKIGANDEALQSFMSTMQIADVMSSPVDGDDSVPKPVALNAG